MIFSYWLSISKNYFKGRLIWFLVKGDGKEKKIFCDTAEYI